MKHFLLVPVAVLMLAACADISPSPVEPAQPRFSAGQTWRIFTTQTPATTVDASPGWEVGTRFYATTAGCITHLHFYRAPGETGHNYAKLWSDAGALLFSGRIANEWYSTDGWYTLPLQPIMGGVGNNIVCIPANTYFRVSVNTNTKQVKTFGYLDNGPIVNGPLVADLSYYGQPTGSMPTQGSGSIYFVDVTFVES